MRLEDYIQTVDAWTIRSNADTRTWGLIYDEEPATATVNGWNPYIVTTGSGTHNVNWMDGFDAYTYITDFWNGHGIETVRTEIKNVENREADDDESFQSEELDEFLSGIRVLEEP